MVNDILEATARAKEVLNQIHTLPAEQLTEELLHPFLQRAALYKLMIDEKEEDNIRNLVILSIKAQDQKAGSLSNEVIGRQIKKYDCHQTSLAAQKKVLLLMFMEKELGIHMSDDHATSIETLKDMAKLVAAYLKEGV